MQCCRTVIYFCPDGLWVNLFTMLILYSKVRDFLLLYLSDGFSAAVINCVIMCTMSCGVPQGSILGPFLLCPLNVVINRQIVSLPIQFKYQIAPIVFQDNKENIHKFRDLNHLVLQKMWNLTPSSFKVHNCDQNRSIQFIHLFEWECFSCVCETLLINAPDAPSVFSISSLNCGGQP